MYFLGIDLHQKSSCCALVNQKGKIIDERKIDTEREPVLEYLKKLPKPVKAVFEPVPNWSAFERWCAEADVPVILAHSLKVRAIAEAKLKNDKVDALILAQLLRTDFLPQAWIAPYEVRQKRAFLRHRVQLVRMRTSAKVRIRMILSRFGLKCKQRQVDGLMARKWIKEQNLPELARVEVDTLFDTIDYVNEKLKKYDKYIVSIFKDDSLARLLTTIPGIGIFSATFMMAEIGDFSRFSHPSKLCRWAGLIPREHSSADKRKFGHITKEGSPWIRWLLVQSVCKVNPKWGELYLFFKRVKEKRGTKIARIALARKILIVAWAMLKRKEPFRLFSVESPDAKGMTTYRVLAN